MRVGIDLRFTAASHMGTGAYAEWAALELLDSLDVGKDQLIGFGTDSKSPFKQDNRFRWVQVPTNTTCGDPELQFRLQMDAAISCAGVDVFFAPTGLSPLVKTCPVVVTIHDLLFERKPEFFHPSLMKLLRREISRSARTAEKIIAISEFTKSEVTNIYGVSSDHMVVIRQGLRKRFQQRPSDEKISESLKALGVDKPYIFALSNHAPHKNTEFALDVFAMWIKQFSANEHQLVIAGGGPSPHASTDLETLIRKKGIEKRVKILGRVDDEHLPALYSGADAFLFPSLFEGWGLPPLESIAMGTPALVSNCGALPEAVADAGMVLSLNEPERWVEALESLATNGTPVDLKTRMDARRQVLLKSTGNTLKDTLLESLKKMSRNVEREPLLVPHVPDKIRAVSLSGCMVIKNGVRLGYPFVEAVMSIIDFVDKMLIVDGGSDDETVAVLIAMARVCSKLVLKSEPWPKVTTGGQVIAIATNSALKHCRGTHILYLQADEIHTEANMCRLRELLHQGYDSAAFPFLHFRTSWWKILANPAYVAAVRCIPAREGVKSILDGVSFGGPIGHCASPELFPDYIYHVGWVYDKNSIEKHINHALIYSDHPSYIEKAEKAMNAKIENQPSLAAIDEEYVTMPFKEEHPAVIRHLLDLTEYQHKQGLDLWEKKFSSHSELSARSIVAMSSLNEDRIIDRLIMQLGFSDRWCVDLGASDGVKNSNSFKLYQEGWSGLAVEACPVKFAELVKNYLCFPNVTPLNARITPINVCELLTRAEVPKDFGVLSLDIDGYDYFVLSELLKQYRPRIVCTEINEKIPPPINFTVLYNEEYRWAGDHFYGQSIERLGQLALAENYSIVYLEYNNAFLIPTECLTDGVKPLSAEEAYRTGYMERPDRLKHFPWNRNMEWLHGLAPIEALHQLKRYFEKYDGNFSCEIG